MQETRAPSKQFPESGEIHRREGREAMTLLQTHIVGYSIPSVTVVVSSRRPSRKCNHCLLCHIDSSDPRQTARCYRNLPGTSEQVVAAVAEAWPDGRCVSLLRAGNYWSLLSSSASSRCRRRAVVAWAGMADRSPAVTWQRM